MKINFNMKRLIATLMVGFVLSGSIKGEVHASETSDYLSNISIISQTEERFQNKDYKHFSYSFENSGCGPSSITNSLLTLFNVTDYDVAGELTEEVLRLVCDGHNKKNNVSLSNLSLLDLDNESYLKNKAEFYPNLYKMITNYSGDIIYMDKILKKDDLVDYLNEGTSDYTFIYKLNMSENWQYIIDMVNTLYKNEKYDANMIFTFTSGGTVRTSGPFRSGKSGHYVSFVINVKDFYENGTIYMLDSNPRGLKGEKIGDGTRYKYRYDFVNKGLKIFDEFRETYNATRIADNVLAFELNDKKLITLHSLLDMGVDNTVDEYRMHLLQSFVTYGTSGVLLSIPYENKKTK